MRSFHSCAQERSWPVKERNCKKEWDPCIQILYQKWPYRFSLYLLFGKQIQRSYKPWGRIVSVSPAERLSVLGWPLYDHYVWVSLLVGLDAPQNVTIMYRLTEYWASWAITVSTMAQSAPDAHLIQACVPANALVVFNIQKSTPSTSSLSLALSVHVFNDTASFRNYGIKETS